MGNGEMRGQTNTAIGLARGAMALMMLLCVYTVSAVGANAGEEAAAPAGYPNLQALFGGGGAAQRSSSEAQLDADSLRSLLSKERNVIVEEQGGMLIVDGRVSSKSAQVRLQKILTKYNNILDLTEFIQDEEAILARADYLKNKIEERLNRGYDPEWAFAPMQRVEYEIVENEVVIVGELNNEADVDQVGKIINTYERGAGGATMSSPTGGPQEEGASGASTDHLTVSKQPLEVDVIFARATASNSRDVGIGKLLSGTITIPELKYARPGSGGATEQVAPAGTKSLRRVWNQHSWSAEEGGISFGQAELNLTELEQSNKILARPHLAALNGTSATFHAGGQLGIRLTGNDSSSVEWKDYGTILTATPTLTSDGRIHLKLSLEISSVDTSGAAVSDDVGLITFTHESEAIIAANQGMVLSGMVQEIRGRGGDGIPGLRKIPIIGYFFGTKGRNVSNEELLVIAIPRFPEVINNHPVATVPPSRSQRLINGVIHEMMGKNDGAKPDVDCETGQPAHYPEVRVDVLPPQVTVHGAVAPSPVTPGYIHPSYEPQQVDLMGDLVAF